jgi:hypothetical protein
VALTAQLTNMTWELGAVVTRLEQSTTRGALNRPKAGAARVLQRQIRLRRSQETQLLEGHESGMTCTELATRHGICRTTVLAVLRRNGIPAKPPVKKMNNDMVTEAAVLYRSGQSLATLGAKFHVEPKAVARELRYAGVTLRPRPGHTN